MQLPKPLVIAIDGPAASGKGTLAKKLAAHFKLPYLDTGKIYRALGKIALKNSIDIEKANQPDVTQKIIKLASNIKLADLDNPELNDEEIGRIASIVSAIPEIRETLVAFQKKFTERKEGAVLDGRDIGTVICPETKFKFFITADLETRAKRRFKQLQNQNKQVIYEAVFQDLKERDKRDSERDISPLKPASDAAYMDTTNMKEGDVFNKLLEIILEIINKEQ